MTAQSTTSPEVHDEPRVARTRGKLVDWKFLVAAAVVGALLVASRLVGEYDVFNAHDGIDMFSITRVPRTIALVLAGAAMAMCGLVMQMLTQNRFVSPTTTGTTEWAGLGLLFVMIVFPGATVMGRMVGAVVFSFVGAMVFFFFLQRVSLRSSLIVPIVGIMLGAVVSAVSTFVALQTDMLQQLGVWFAGSFTSVYKGQYEVLWVVLLVVVGNLPFLGLIVPNIVSMIRGDDLRSNLPWVCLVGIATVAACDLLARTLISPFEIPVSVVLGIVGAVVFVVLIVRNR